jgi:hypothetical protein
MKKMKIWLANLESVVVISGDIGTDNRYRVVDSFYTTKRRIR